MTQALSKNPTPREISDRVNQIIAQYQRVQVKEISTHTASYTVTIDDSTLLGDATSGNITFTLPKAANAENFVYDFKKIDSSANTVTIDGDGSETIDGATTYVLSDEDETVRVHSDGTAWYVFPDSPALDIISGWRDITAEITVRGVGASDPTWSQIGSGPFYSYKFAVSDECWMAFHVPHDYIPGTDIYIHTHWLPDGTNTAEVKWQYTYTYAHGHNQDNFSATGTTVTAAQSPPGTAYRHMVTESNAITITDMEVDGIIYVHIERITNGGTDNTDGIFVLTNDIHYESNNSATLNRAPDFYS
jgi:hypothetical protein